MVLLASPPPAAPATAADLAAALCTNRAAALARLYRQAFPRVRHYVLRHGGHAADAQDMFQDGLVRLFEKALADELPAAAEPGAYLAGICRHLWQRELARRQRLPPAELHEAHYLPDDAAEPAPAEQAAAELAQQHLARLGDKCRALLLGFYYFGQPLAELAATHGYGSVRSATVQKFKCLERLRRAMRAALA